MKYEHEIIRDLMPLCADGIASPESEAAVQAHIAECAECAAEWEQMQKGIQASKEEPAEQEGYVKTATRLRKKNRWVLLKVVLCTLVLVFGGYIALNYADGARFTLRGALLTLCKRIILPKLTASQMKLYSQFPSTI